MPKNKKKKGGQAAASAAAEAPDAVEAGASSPEPEIEAVSDDEASEPEAPAASEAGEEAKQEEPARGSEENPIPFLTLDDNSEFQLHAEAADYLRAIKGPVAVVSIAGLYRTGKSFLLNLLLGRQTGFDVGGTVNACTKGLWLWGAPVRLEDRDLTVLFVDSEGLGSTQRSSTQDTRIFALAILLASYFVYNSRGVIDSNAIDDLSLVINLTKFIHVRSTQDDEAADLHQFFPSFLWVVRDFTLQLEDQGKRITSRQYLENALKPQNGFSDAIQQKNQIRQLLSNFFPTRDCVTLVRPATDEDVLRNLATQPVEALRPEFVRQVETLKSKLFASLKPKQMMGKTLNGPMLLSLAEAYVTAMNSGGVPVISTAWDRVVSSQCEEATEAAIDAYRRRMASHDPSVAVESADLAETHASAKREAKELFARTALQDPETLAPFKARLREFFREQLEELQAANAAASLSACSELVAEMHGEIVSRESQMLDTATNDADANGLLLALLDYKGALENMVAEYAQRARGPAKEQAMNRFLGANVMAKVVEWGEFVTTRFREQAQRMTAEIEAARNELSQTVGREKAAKEMLEQQKASYEGALTDAGEKLAEEKMRLRETIDGKQNELERTMQLMNQLNATHETQQQREMQRLQEAQEQIRQLESRLDNTREVHTDQVRVVNRELLESERTFHKEEKTLMRGQQDLMSSVLNLERQLGEKNQEHLQAMFTKDHEHRTAMMEAERKWEQERSQLVAQHREELASSTAQFESRIRVLEDELSEKRAFVQAAQERMARAQAAQAATPGGSGGKRGSKNPDKEMCKAQ